MSGFELEHERGKPPARVRTRQVSRSVLDDVSTWWNGPENVAVRQQKPEKPVTKQDFDQIMSMVHFPVQLSHQDVFGKKPDAATCKTAGARLTPAASALQVIANSKHEPKNQQSILAALPDIQAAQTTLQVMGDDAKAPDIWHEAFQTAQQVLDVVLALPVIDPDAAKDTDTGDAPPADGVQKRDHDLLEASIKPLMQRLITTTSRTPGLEWDPSTYTEGSETLFALESISHPKLKPAIDAVRRGVQAVTAWIHTVESNVNAVSNSLESAMQKLSDAQTPYIDEATAAASAEQPK